MLEGEVVNYRDTATSEWPTLTRGEFCIQQRSVVVGEVLAACFAGFLLLLVFLVFGELHRFTLSKTLEWNEECIMSLLKDCVNTFFLIYCKLDFELLFELKRGKLIRIY